MKLKNIIEEKKYKLILTELESNSNGTLSLKLDIDINYGNKALRYFVGYGAGKGTIHSDLKVIDKATGKIKFHADSKSELKIGAFGGDMKKVIKKNIDILLNKYKVY